MTEPSDLLHELVREHRQQAAVLRRLAETPEAGHGSAFAAATLDLAAHLAATEAMVHPLAADVLADGHTTVVHRRLEARTVLHHLREAGRRLDAPGCFREAASRAVRSFATYSEREELEVFPFARHAVDRDELTRLGDLLQPVRGRALTAYTGGADGPPPCPWDDGSLLPRLVRGTSDALQELGPPRLASGPDPAATQGGRQRAMSR